MERSRQTKGQHHVTAIGRVAFGPFVLDLPSRTLKHRSRKIRLRPKEFELLTLLAGSAQSVVTKDEIIRTVWRNADVSESALTQAIYRLRKVLTDSDPEELYIVSDRGLGYQFTKRVYSESFAPDVLEVPFRRYQRAVWCRATTNPAAINQGIKTLELALEEEPNYTDALVAISEMYITAANLLFLEPAFALERADYYINKALRLEPSSSEPYGVLSSVLLHFKQDAVAACNAANDALAFCSDSQRGLSAMVWALIARNEAVEAIAYAKRLLRATPASPDSAALLGVAFYYSRSFDEALVRLYDALEMDPANGYALNYAIRCLCALERYDEASRVARTAKIKAATPYIIALEAYIAGRRNTLNGPRLKVIARELSGHHILNALISLGCGNNRRAEEHLNAAAQKKEPALIFARRDPLFRTSIGVRKSR